MTTYNHEPYIAHAIESVLMQETNFDVELLVGEDCSTDSTGSIVRSFADRHPDRMRAFIRRDNVGGLANFLDIFAQSKGTYIALLDGDDYWHRPDKLAKQVAVLEADSECSFVCSDYDQFDMATSRRLTSLNAERGLDPSQLADIRYIIRGTPTSGIQLCTILARRDLLHQVLTTDPEFVDPKGPAGDTPISAGLAALGPIAYLPESLGTYRLISESCTRSTSPTRILKTSIRMKEQILRICEHHRLPDAESALHRQDLLMRQLKLAFMENDPAAAAEAHSRLGALTPIQWLQVQGLRSRTAHVVARSLLKHLDRRLIPTTSKP